MPWKTGRNWKLLLFFLNNLQCKVIIFLFNDFIFYAAGRTLHNITDLGIRLQFIFIIAFQTDKFPVLSRDGVIHKSMDNILNLA